MTLYFDRKIIVHPACNLSCAQNMVNSIFCSTFRVQPLFFRQLECTIKIKHYQAKYAIAGDSLYRAFLVKAIEGWVSTPYPR